jgi:hypothetical protein
MPIWKTSRNNTILLGIPSLLGWNMYLKITFWFHKQVCYLAFQYFDKQHIWWSLLQKLAMRTKFDIYFFNYHCVDTSAGGILVPEGIIHPVVGVSALTWFIRYIYYWNVQFLRKVWRYQRGKQNSYIEEEQTTQWPKEKSTKEQTTIYKTYT